MATLGPASWFLIAAGIAGGSAYFGEKYLSSMDVGKKVVAASTTVSQKLTTQDVKTEASTFNLPAANGEEVRVISYAWNANIGMHRAMAPVALAENGYFYSGKNSIYSKQNLKVGVTRQDNADKIAVEQLKFAAELSKGVAQPKAGAHFAVIMGDGAPAYLASSQAEFKKLGQQLEVIGRIGYSFGEDKVMMPPAVRDNPQLARGMTLIGVIPDGDWNIAVQFFNDHGIPINPDVKTHDANAVNFWKVGDVAEADALFIAGTCEDRKIVKNGVILGQTKRVCPEGLMTWTPCDVNVATKRGGVVSVASTKQYRHQMAATVIGVKSWNQQNSLTVQNMLAGAFKGADLIMKNDSELDAGARVSATVYKEQDAQYWTRYFKGVTQKDMKGIEVELGGSAVSNLASNVYYFGLNGTPDIYEQVYKIYGGYAVHYYPDVVSALVPYKDVVNTTYLQALMKVATNVKQDESEVVDYAVEAQSGRVVGDRTYTIEFETGKASFKSEKGLNELRSNLLLSEMLVEIHGHTDNVGDPMLNKDLSARRSVAVKTWLVGNGIPVNRVRSHAHGDTNPIAENTTEAGRAKNRRVVIKLVG